MAIDDLVVCDRLRSGHYANTHILPGERGPGECINPRVVQTGELRKPAVPDDPTDLSKKFHETVGRPDPPLVQPGLGPDAEVGVTDLRDLWLSRRVKQLILHDPNMPDQAALKQATQEYETHELMRRNNVSLGDVLSDADKAALLLDAAEALVQATKDGVLSGEQSKRYNSMLGAASIHAQLAQAQALEALSSCVKDGVLQMRDVDRAKVYGEHLGERLR